MKLFKPNSERIVKILTSIKIAIGALAISSYATDQHKLGFWLLAGGGTIDIILSAFSSNEPTNKNNNEPSI